MVERVVYLIAMLAVVLKHTQLVKVYPTFLRTPPLTATRLFYGLLWLQ